MENAETQDYRKRVFDILKVFAYKYGLKADVVNVNSQTIGTKAYKIMKIILNEQNIPIEVDD